MRSPLAESQREALIEAMLPEVAFDGWSRPALRAAARRIGMPADEALAVFPGGTADLVACFSRWADLRMLDRLESEALDPLRVPERIALAQQHQRLARCLEELDSRHSASIRAAFLDGATYEELATRMSVPLGTMKSWIRRGLLKLRTCLEA